MTERITITEYRELRRAKTRRVKRDYKAEFLNQLHLAGLPQPDHGAGCELPELVFAPPRRFRFDYAWKCGVAAEYHGGNYHGKGAHNTIAGLRRDYEKQNEAALRGWLLILIDSESVRDGRALDWVRRALLKKMGEVKG